MIKIRQAIFETNSSSSHSLQIADVHNINHDLLKLFIDRDGTFRIMPEEFGWEFNSYRDAYTKLQYAFEMIYETELSYDDHEVIEMSHDLNKIYQTDGFKALKTLLMSIYKDCTDVIIDIEVWDDYYPLGYIDHQSYEGYRSLQNFLDSYDITLEQFIFDNGVCLETGNDN